MKDDHAGRDELVAALRTALASAFEQQTAGVEPTDVVGLGVFTDADATSMVVVGNTRDHRDAVIAAKPEYADDAVWDMGQWSTPARGMTGLGPSPLKPFERVFEQVHRDIQGDAESGEPVMRSRRFIWGAILAAMVELRGDGFFARWPDAVIEMDAYDAEVEFEEIAGWVDELNPPEVARGFHEFLGVD